MFYKCSRVVSATTACKSDLDASRHPIRRAEICNASDSIDLTMSLSMHDKDEETKHHLFDSLILHYLFQSLSEEELTLLINSMRLIDSKAGDVIIKQGDPGDAFYVLRSGVATAYVEGKGEVMKYEDSGCFGELALLYNSPRAASVIATTDCVLYTLDMRCVFLPFSALDRE
jgi:cAMP-dependent protein kinase regulator